MIIRDDQPIIALCTPIGSGALALLRLTGTGSVELADKCAHLPNGKFLSTQKSHTVHYGTIVDENNKKIDQVMFIVMRGPKTFTGQDTVEITCHNNQFIIQEIINTALAHGARIADNGEFTRRAVLNNKIDLLQAEAINELIHAQTQQALKQSLAQIEGSFSSWITTIEQQLLKALAFCEASFEFIDEEMTFDTTITKIITNTCTTIAKLKKIFSQQQHIKDGIRIALIGSVNAGKSSLFNALLQKQRAIVTEIAGTTRDVIEAGVFHNGNHLTFVDTAGLRKTEDVVEQAGIEKSFEQAHLADIILLVIDGARTLTEQEKNIYQKLHKQFAQKIIVVVNKADLPQKNSLFTTPLTISTKTGNGLVTLEQQLDKKIHTLFSAIESPFLLNKRQFNLLLNLEQKLQTIHDMLNGTVAHELIAYHLNDALTLISELTGKTVSEKGMDAIFKQFCVGK